MRPHWMLIVEVRLAIALAAAVVVSSPVFAQSRATTADLSGVILDESKAVLPGVTITATNASTGLDRTTVSEGNGRFSIPALPPGPYKLRVELSGFATQERENIVLALGQSVDLEFTLKLAGTTEAVTV